MRVEKPQQLTGVRILVVEDNLINQQLAEEILRDQGALVELADNGQSGLAAIDNAKPPYDIVLMDIQMPLMDGYAATRAIRNEMGLTELPVIAMTANAFASDREACLAAGMNDHVSKPIDVRRLVDLLRRVTDKPNVVDAGTATFTHLPSAPTQQAPRPACYIPTRACRLPLVQIQWQRSPQQPKARC